MKANETLLYGRLVEMAEAKLNTTTTRTREDGSAYEYRPSQATATEGGFQIYVVPVQGRVSARRKHLRVTYYLLQDGSFKRVSEAAWVSALESVAAGF